MRNLAQRVIVPELLDGLPIADPGAIGSRRDLIKINSLMFQARIMTSLIRSRVTSAPRRILELGSGDGAFMLSIGRHMRNRWSNVDIVMVDKVDLMTDARRSEFAALGWRAEFVVGDIFEFTSKPVAAGFDLVCANLVLHHFSDEALRKLFASVRSLTSCFIATEPNRNAVALAACSLLRLIGANDVTMHDAAASVRSGFRSGELSKLWPTRGESDIEERRAGPFTHAFAVGQFDAV
jgi:2-polyprenyl-3-methyl-5-hydroxy-6-metoxy-1,4-benzoquinol methylase